MNIEQKIKKRLEDMDEIEGVCCEYSEALDELNIKLDEKIKKKKKNNEEEK